MVMIKYRLRNTVQNLKEHFPGGVSEQARQTRIHFTVFGLERCRESPYTSEVWGSFIFSKKKRVRKVFT